MRATVEVEVEVEEKEEGGGGGWLLLWKMCMPWGGGAPL